MQKADAWSRLVLQSQTAPNIKPYSAASAVLLSELIKGAVSFLLAVHKAYSDSHHAHAINSNAAYEPLLPSSSSSGKRDLGSSQPPSLAGFNQSTCARLVHLVVLTSRQILTNAHSVEIVDMLPLLRTTVDRLQYLKSLKASQ